MIKKTSKMEIPAIGLGTWQLKGERCKKSVESALEIGYRHIDTARMYGNEKQVGQGIEESDVDRKDIFLTTKIQPSNLDYSSVKEEMEKSL
ncbi:MAG: aldo/keto reductase, partial [Candidatus Aenigmatarchaeota archaeon]